jgi:dipeptidyl aminopeptidase/acylaminoacyl peptidase
MRRWLSLCAGALACGAYAYANAQAAAPPSAPPQQQVPPPASLPADRFGPEDLDRLAAVSEPQFSPDGAHLVYTLTSVNVVADRQQSDIWRVRYDGGGREPLTHTPEIDESHPRYAPDGSGIAFLADRGAAAGGAAGDVADDAQVWLLPAAGGAARRLTDLPGAIEDYAFSPDGRRLAVIAWDAERPAGTAAPKNPPPIVTTRYQFKEDITGYLGDRHKHLYLVDIASGVATALTSGEHDEQLPAWSPDGRTIAYVTKRGVDPDRTLNYDLYLIEARAGTTERQLTHFAGADLDPYWESYPAWSPDGRHIAYLRSGADRWIYYAPWQLAVIEVASGRETLPAPIDRCFFKPRWSSDGRSIYALIEQSRVTHLARISWPEGRISELTHGARFDVDVAIAGDGRVVVLGGDDGHLYELAALEGGAPRLLGPHNDWLAGKRLASVEDIQFRSADGTPIDGLLVKPPDYQPGRRYPTILAIHGGPVYQFSHEFMPDWQGYAARGFVVVAANPRGSSGRGFDFARAIRADWGHRDVQDVLAAVDYAVRTGIADPARLGVGGRSYGGILTDYVIASDRRFRAAVSGAGSANALAMYGSDEYTRDYELELGPPWRQRALYERLSYPFLHADRIATPTLFYCAAADFNVPCIGSEQMYQALRSQGVPTQLVIYPGENHALRVPSYLRDRMQRLTEWYLRYLQP